MKKILAGFMLLFLILTGLTVWLFLQKPEQSSLNLFLQQRWPQIKSGLPVVDALDLTFLIAESRPAELTNVELFLAHFHLFNPEELQNLFRLSQHCQETVARPKSPSLQKAWMWVRQGCALEKLPQDFFKKPPYIFPSGQSYVHLAEEVRFDFSGYLTNEEMKTYKTLSESLAMTSVGSDLDLQQLKGFINGEEILIGERSVYLKLQPGTENSRSRAYQRLPIERWLKEIKSEDFVFTSQFSDRCEVKWTNGCWMPNLQHINKTRRIMLLVVLILDGFVLALALSFNLIDRKRRKHHKDQQRFVLQMLTHELRTPVTTLALQLETVRHDFDHLSQNQQVQFLKMSQEIHRLKNSMQMSYAYLQTDAVNENNIKIQMEKIDINLFLKSLLEQYNDENPEITFKEAETVLFIQAEPLWLELCLKNLIQNAFQHGKPPVLISILVQKHEIGLQVSDCGQIQKAHLNQFTQPFEKRPNSKGLGLGLSIVQQILQAMSGRLSIEHSPTRFTLFLKRSNENSFS